MKFDILVFVWIKSSIFTWNEVNFLRVTFWHFVSILLTYFNASHIMTSSRGFLLFLRHFNYPSILYVTPKPSASESHVWYCLMWGTKCELRCICSKVCIMSIFSCEWNHVQPHIPLRSGAISDVRNSSSSVDFQHFSVHYLKAQSVGAASQIVSSVTVTTLTKTWYI